MLKKGYSFYLEPEKFEKHRKLADKLLRASGWERRDSDDPKRIVTTKIEHVDDPDKVLPHQQTVIEQIRKNLQVTSSS